MRRNWDDILMLLEISEKLAGHPNLKSIRDEAAEDLKELVECPPNSRDAYVPEDLSDAEVEKAEPNLEPGTDTTETKTPVVRRRT